MRQLILILFCSILSAESVIRLDTKIEKVPILKYRLGQLFIKEGATYPSKQIESITINAIDQWENYQFPVLNTTPHFDAPTALKDELETLHKEAQKFAKLFPTESAVFHSIDTTIIFDKSNKRLKTTKFSLYIKDINLLERDICSIPYQSGTQSIASLEAYLRKPSGEIIKFDKLSSFTSIANSQTHQYSLNLFPPKAKSGSLISIKYTIKDEVPLINTVEGIYKFRNNTPVLRSTFKLKIPGKGVLSHELSNAIESESIAEIKLNLETGEKSFSWKLNNPSKTQGFPTLYFTIATNWKTITSAYNKLIKKCQINDKNLKDMVNEITSNKKEITGISKIYYWIQKHISLMPHHQNLNAIKNTSQVLIDRSGNALERTILFTAMLNLIGVKAEVVFTVSKEIPPTVSLAIDTLDKPLCAIPSKIDFLYLDCGSNDIKTNFMANALTERKVIHLNSGNYVRLKKTSKNYSGSTIQSKGIITEKGEINLTSSFTFFGHNERKLRRQLRSTPATKHQKVLNQLIESYDSKLTKLKITNPDDLNIPLTFTAQYSRRDATLTHNDKRFVQLPELAENNKLNEFSNHTVTFLLSFPKNWTLNKDNDVSFGNPEANSSYRRTCKINKDSSITIYQEYRISKKEPSDQTLKLIKRLSKKPLIFTVN